MTTIEVKNDYMLGRQNENILYYKCMELEQENKQLKEDFAVLKKLQMISNDILNELEKYYKEQLEFIVELPVYTKDIAQEHKVMELCYEDFLNKIQELKEKYK